MSVPVLSYRASPAPGRLSIDLEQLVRSRMLAQANSGGGKSRALRQLLEETYGRVQHLVLDPEGEFASLRERFPYVLAAAKGGDVAATPKTARILARKLMELGASAVLDLYDLELGERREFVQLFLTELMHLPRELWRPLFVVIDEAHVFCPEHGAGEARSAEAVITLCTQGRKRGYCAVLATQRISKLHKDAAAELLNKLVGRTGLDVDVKRAGDELGFDKEQRAQLKTLAPGEFFVYGPAIAASVTKVRTGDVLTSHPEAGRVAAPPPPAPTAVRAMLEQLKDLPQEAAEEARTLEELRRANATLERQVRQLQRGAPAPVERVVEKPVADEAAIARAVDRAVTQVAKDVQTREARRLKIVAQIAGTLERAVSRFGEASALVAQSATDLRQLQELPPIATPATNGNGNGSHASSSDAKHLGAPLPRASRPASSPAAGLSGPQQRILDALAWFEAMGLAAVAKSNAAVFADASPTSSAYANNLGTLRSKALIDYPRSGEVALTEAGRQLARAESPGTIEDLHAAWQRKLPRPQWRILEAVIEAYPASVDRDELATIAEQSPSSSAYANNLGTLRSLGLLDKQPGRVGATKLLFPEGLS